MAVLRPAAVALAVLAAAAPALPASAQPDVPLEPTAPFDLTWSATDNVEHLGRFPEHAGTAGAALSEDRRRLYLTDPRGVYVYDTSDPASPDLLGSLSLYQTGLGAALAQEDPDTNGEILLVDAATSPTGTAQLRIVDVSDPQSLRLLASVPVTDHTWTCVTGTAADGELDSCAWAYGRTGYVVDLRDPAAPVLLDASWRTLTGYGSAYTHDFTEIRPGLLMTAGASAALLDVRDPARPVLLTEIGDRGRFPSLGYHSVEWARGGRDRYVVVGTEIAPGAVPGAPPNTAGSDCEGESSVVETWDAREVLAALEQYEATGDRSAFQSAQFRRVDSYDAGGRGLFVEGKGLASQLYCAHWMELHPDFKKGGLVAIAYYDRGTRFVRVGEDGVMTEVGWLTAAEGYAGSPQWVSDDVVYVMDYRRGLEVLRLKDSAATQVVHRAPDVVSPASAGLRADWQPHLRDLALGGGALLLLLVVVERTARRRTAATP